MVKVQAFVANMSEEITEMERKLAKLTEENAKLTEEKAQAEAKIAKEKGRADSATAQLRALKLSASNLTASQTAKPAFRTCHDYNHAARPIPVRDDESQLTLTMVPDLACVDFSMPPLSHNLARLSTVKSTWQWQPTDPDDSVDATQDILRESRRARSLAVEGAGLVPPWIEVRTLGQAVTIFLKSQDDIDQNRSIPLASYPTLPGAKINWECTPELGTTVRNRYLPAYNGEMKSAMSSGEHFRLRMFDELITYVMQGMLASYFRGLPRGCHRYFRAPPYGFGLAAFPHVGYIVLIEWVGKLLVSVVSQPFFVGSPEHAEAIKRLPERDFAAEIVDVRLADVEVGVWPEVGKPAVVWRIQAPSDGTAEPFFKIICGDGFDAATFRCLFAVYSAYNRALADAAEAGDEVPQALVKAELLFGAGEVCIQMEWVPGRPAQINDLLDGGVAVEPVARAIVWLARHGLIYIDLREPNVLLVEDAGATTRVVLIDYDECLVVDPPPATSADLCSLLEENALFAQVYSPGYRPAVINAIVAAWLPAAPVT